MSTKSIKALYHTVNWDEKVMSEEGAALKITRVRSERKFSGAMTGTGIAEYIICYHADGSLAEGTCSGMPTSSYTGKYRSTLPSRAKLKSRNRIQGSIDGSAEGEVIFIVENGKFTGTAQADWLIDEKTAIGGLKGLKGKGGYKHEATAKCADGTNVWFDYTL